MLYSWQDDKSAKVAKASSPPIADGKKVILDAGSVKKDVEKVAVKKESINEEAGKLLEELKVQRAQQQELINQQKEIIADLQRHKAEDHKVRTKLLLLLFYTLATSKVIVTL